MRQFARLSLVVGLTLGWGIAAGAEADDPVFRVAGDTLIYDTTQEHEAGGSTDIEVAHIDRLLELLRQNPEIRVLDLNSTGGSLYAGREMARIVLDFDLDTLVSGECFSSCVRIFLAGAGRRMLLGAKIGFHQTTWSPRSVEEYYTANREADGWETPFDFVSWVYEDTQSEVHDDLVYMIDRGVDAGFAVRTKGVRADDSWYPSRLELTRAGVLRERARAAE
ncbi:hypothetical protein KBY28_11825 [Ruegeria pomeroyi]|uniref:COG3904 family protein n=1 Tax=Ruegeria pomeroyi TaxID=89184 RepID=UPI001F334DF6|nr:hypothetical protein [Ruegeria pomeroyi]MCE8509138.1 hypothetical protein [Ruegeria pomeroyi]